MLASFVIALVLVAVAEFGDKTQMLTLVLSARYGARKVLLGVAGAICALQLVAVAAGGLVGSLIPEGVLRWVTGLLFIGFGLWTLLARDSSDDVEEEAQRSGLRGPILGTAAAFFLAELGDKTQIMTMTIAADPSSVSGVLSALGPLAAPPGSAGLPVLAAVWVGSTLGMLLVNGAAALVGTALGSRLSPVLVKRVSGAIFIVFGLLALAAPIFGG